MTTYAGAILPSGLPSDPAYGAAYKFLPASLTLPFPGALASNPPNAGAMANNLPVAEIVVGFSGTVVRQFEQDWYHHVHLLPAKIALGNLLSTQMRQVEVWNAHFAPKTLSAVIGENDGGITLAAPANPPTTYGMLESRLHNVSVSLDGPPVIEADFTFQFPDEAPTLSISGRRVVVFGLKPNWANGWLERLMWATDVLTARDGTEQRVGLRAKPRRSLEFSILVGSADAALLDVLLSAWQSRVYALPIWPDKAVLTAAVAAGSTVIPLTTTNLEYEADGLLVIGTDSRNTEAAEVLSIASNAVTLKQPLLQPWPAGAFVTPARTARLRITQAVSRVTDAIATARLVFDIAGTTAITKQDSSTTFNSTAVWITRPNRVRDVESDYQRLAEVLDFDTGSLCGVQWQYRENPLRIDLHGAEAAGFARSLPDRLPPCAFRSGLRHEQPGVQGRRHGECALRLERHLQRISIAGVRLADRGLSPGRRCAAHDHQPLRRHHHALRCAARAGIGCAL